MLFSIDMSAKSDKKKHFFKKTGMSVSFLNHYINFIYRVFLMWTWWFYAIYINLNGLKESMVVLQQGVHEVRRELHSIKDILSERVIWQNDNISILTKEGEVIYGVINKSTKKWT